MQKMTMLKTVLVCALLAVACGDSDDDAGDAAAGATGGNGTGGNGTGGNGTGGNGMGGCDDQGNSGGQSNCTQKEQDDYSACLQGACTAEYKKCLGDDYASGKFGGVCGTYQECQVACDCDTACIQKCGTPSMECTSCYLEISSCTQQACPIPACFTAGATAGLPEGGIPGAGKTCADLKTCCDAMADMAARDQCTQTLGAVMAGGDTACGIAYSGLCM